MQPSTSNGTGAIVRTTGAKLTTPDIGAATATSITTAALSVTALSNGKIPYHVSDASGLADGPTKTDVDDAVTKKHAAVTIDGTSPLSLSTQALSLKNDADAAITEVDTGTLANSDTVVPTSKAVKAYADGKATLAEVKADADISSAISLKHAAVTLAAGATSNILSLSTQELSVKTQSANLVLAGPASGAAAAPTFRSLTADDIPSLSGLYLPLSGGSITGNVSVNAASGGSVSITGSGAVTIYGKNDWYPALSLQTFSEAQPWHMAFWESRRARGTLASPAAVIDNDSIFAFDCWGYDGDQWQRCGQITARVVGTVSDNVIPCQWLFQTMNTSGSLGSRMVITSDGPVGINTNTPAAKLAINGGLHVGGDSDPGDNNLLVDGTGTITGAFGCNSKTAQTAYASGGALAAYGTGSYGLDSAANMSALHALVVKIRAALVANGIMS